MSLAETRSKLDDLITPLAAELPSLPQTETQQGSTVIDADAMRLQKSIELAAALVRTQPKQVLQLLHLTKTFAEQLQQTELRRTERLAEIELRTGEAQMWLGAFQAAIRSFECAESLAQTSGNLSLELEAAIWRGRCLDKTGDTTGALKTLTASVERATTAGESASALRAWSALGIFHKDRGDYDAAAACHREALKIAEATGHLSAKSAVWLNLGNLYRAKGDAAEALKNYTAALDTRRKMHDRRGEAGALHNIGLIYGELGDMDSALGYFQQALLIQEPISTAESLVSRISLGAAYFYKRDTANALRHLLRALRDAEEVGRPTDKCIVQANLTDLYIFLKEYDKAQAHLAERDRLAKQFDLKPEQAESLIERGVLYVLTGQPQHAETSFQTALTFSAEHGLILQAYTAQMFLSELALKAGDRKKCAAHRAEANRLLPAAFVAENRAAAKALLRTFELRALETEFQSLGIEGKAIEELLSALGSKVAESEPVRKVSVRTFGAFSVRIDGRELSAEAWGRKKARDLFKVLLLQHRTAVTTDELVDKLRQPQSGDKSVKERNAEAVLQNAVSYIRKALEPHLPAKQPSQYLLFKDRAYTLNLGEGAEIDFIAFKNFCAEARTASSDKERRTIYEKAIEIYAGDFLKEDLYEDWAAYERETLKDLYLTALGAVAASQTASGEMEAATATAEKMIASDYTSEAGYERLLTLAKAKGDRTQLQKIFKRCTEAFKKEFDTPPPKRLSDLAK